MEDPEVPLEQLQDEINERAAERRERWTLGVALTSAFLASLAAVASLTAGHYANEAMMSQIESSSQWSFFQSKSIKEAQLKSKDDILEALGKPAGANDKAKALEYKQDKEKIQADAEGLQKEAKHYLHKHHFFARSVTMFQIAIVISAISLLTRRKSFWFLSMVFGTIGLIFVAQAFMARGP
jgi:uncharacterized protein DUF4337